MVYEEVLGSISFNLTDMYIVEMRMPSRITICSLKVLDKINLLKDDFFGIDAVYVR